MSLTMVDYTCERCGASFQHRSEGKRKYRFCTQHCGNLARRKVTAEMLLPYVDGGVCSNRIATELKISDAAVLPALRRFGLYRRWCERRYKKCASLTVGSSSASTVSATVISPSVESVGADGWSYELWKLKEQLAVNLPSAEAAIEVSREATHVPS